MKKCLLIMALWICFSNFSLAILSGIPWGSTEEYIMANEKNQFGYSEEVLFEKEIPNLALVFASSFLGRDLSPLQYVLWEDQLYQIRLYFMFDYGELNEIQFNKFQDVVTTALTQKYGISRLSSLYKNCFVWETEEIIIEAQLDSIYNTITYTHKQLLHQMELSLLSNLKLDDLNKL